MILEWRQVITNYWMTGCRWEAVRLQLGRLRQALFAFGRVVAPQAYAHGREKVCLFLLQSTFHALWSFDQTHSTSRTRTKTSGLARGQSQAHCSHCSAPLPADPCTIPAACSFSQQSFIICFEISESKKKKRKEDSVNSL